MSKILVLSADHSGARDGVLTPLTAAVAAGAEGVKFAEVDVRHLDAAPARTLSQYDAVILGAPNSADPGLHQWLAQVESLTGADRPPDTVAAVFTPDGEPGPLLLAVARLGFLLVPAAAAPLTADSARALGRRVTTVAGWVRHAKSHAH